MRFDCLFWLMRARHSTDDEVHPIDLSALGNLLVGVHGRSIGDERVVLALRMQLLAPPRAQSSWELRVGHQQHAVPRRESRLRHSSRSLGTHLKRSEGRAPRHTNCLYRLLLC